MNPVIFLLIISFLTIITIQCTSAQTLINTTCKTSSKNDPNIAYGFCATSLQAAPASRCAVLRGLGSISIRLVRYNVTDTRCLIKQLIKEKKWDPYQRQCLDDCFQLFSDAIDSVKQAMRYYNAKKFDDANLQISSIMDAATTCEDGFKDRNLVSPLKKRNENVFQLSAIVLSIMKMVQRGSGLI